jgi:hypothetical protein
MPTDTYRSRCTVFKSLPDGFAPAVNGKWAYASVEVPDREGDVIRVKGIDLSLHREESPIKVFGLPHRYVPLPTGEPPIVGVVREFRVTTTRVKGYGEVPALAFRFEYTGKDEEPATFATKCKGAIESGVLDSFSGRFERASGKPIGKMGTDVQSCQLAEISVVPFPVNPHATVLKALVSALGDDFDPNEYLDERLAYLCKSVDALDLDARFDALRSDLTKSMTSFRDDIESLIAAAPKSAGQDDSATTRQPDPLAEVHAALARVKARLK